MYPKETRYNGEIFRTDLEARWAVFFDSLGIEYEYRPEGIPLSGGAVYHPDFFLPCFNCYFAVRDFMDILTPRGKEAERLIRAGHDSGDWAGIIAFGGPWDQNLHIYCQETDDGGGGSYDARVAFARHPDSKRPCLFAFEDWRKRSFFDSFGEDMEIIPLFTTECGVNKYDDFVTAGVRRAAEHARAVCFEHGQAIIPPLVGGRRYR